ncbi:MAG: MCE family protein [Xanthomonadales bacterium]|nr:MCE family protein [Xanthomonadales bacterium]
METRAHHVLIGAFTLGAALLALLFIAWLGRLQADQAFDEYDVVFQEAVIGLSIGGTVTFNGIQIGEVRRLSLDPTDPRVVVARVRVRGGAPVNSDTRATLTITGLTGLAVIDLTGGKPDSPPLEPPPGYDVPRLIADQSALAALMEGGKDVVTRFNETIARLNHLLNEENTERFGQTLANIEQATAALASNDAGVRPLLLSSNEAIEELRQAFAEIGVMAERANKVIVGVDHTVERNLGPSLDDLRQSMAALKQTTEQAVLLVEQTRGTVGEFGDEGMVPLAEASQELNRTLRALRRLIEALESRPADFLLQRDQPREMQP